MNALPLILVACTGPDPSPAPSPPVPTPTTRPDPPAMVDVSLIHRHTLKTVVVQRPGTTPTHALDALFAGPTPEEQDRGLTLVRSGATGFADLTVDDGIARVRLVGGCDGGGATVTIYDAIHATLVGFESIDHVKLLDPQGTTGKPDGPTDSRPACLQP